MKKEVDDLFEFGVAVRDITPKNDMVIPGYYVDRYVEGVLDNLYAKAMAFDDGENAFLIVVCDAINLDRDDVLRIRRGIKEKRGISEKNISVSATHTHTGGPVCDWGQPSDNKLYMNMLISSAISAACEAFDKRVPAKIGFAKDVVRGYSFIRRYMMKNGKCSTNPGVGSPDIVEPIGTPDESFVVGKVCDLDENPLAFISNFGVHLDMIGGNKVSADYPGVLSSLIKERFGENVESVFLTAPCGNTNHLNQKPIEVIDKTESGLPEDAPFHIQTGHALFNKLCEIEKDIILFENVTVKASREFLSAKLRIPEKEYIEQAKSFLRGETDSFGYSDWSADNRMAKMALEAYNNPVHMIDVEIMTCVIENTAFVLWPAEIFVEYGKAVREEFADKNIIISELSNGSFGCYLPTAEAIFQGGYEPAIASPVTPDVQIGAEMVNETIKMIQGN